MKVKPEITLVKSTFGEHRFGKVDKVLKFGATPSGFADGKWKLAGPEDVIQGVLFVGRNGRTFVADFSRYPAKIQAFMTFHGAKQKLGDEYANLDTVDDCLEAAIALDDRLANGKWEVEAKGFAGVSVLMRAIMEVFGKTEDESRAFLKDLKPDEKTALRNTPELKPVVERLEGEKVKEVDTNSVLAKLKPTA